MALVGWAGPDDLRRGPSFAVADAYERWYDLTEDEVAAILS